MVVAYKGQNSHPGPGCFATLCRISSIFAEKLLLYAGQKMQCSTLIQMVERRSTMGDSKKSSLKKYMGKTHPAVIAVWAALIAVSGMLPAIPIIGTGATFSVSSALIPLAGVLFGPISGAVCAAVGCFLEQMVAPHTAWLGLGTFVLGTITAFVAGLIIKRNWWLPVAIIGLGGVLWFTTPIGREVPMFAIVLYGLGIIGAIIGGIVTEGLLKSANVFYKGLGVWFASFTGMIAAAAVGNYLCLLVINIPADVWKVLIPVAPSQRALFAVGAAVIGVPLIIALPKIGVNVGVSSDEEEEE
jgi:uncharacterized membrane protein